MFTQELLYNINHKILCGSNFYFENSWAIENIFWTLSSQDKVRDYQCSFIIYIWKHNTYKFLYLWKPENNIYWAYTGVDPGMSSMGDASCQHPNHSSRAIISHIASVEWKYHLPICDIYHRSSIGARSTT